MSVAVDVGQRDGDEFIRLDVADEMELPDLGWFGGLLEPADRVRHRRQNDIELAVAAQIVERHIKPAEG